MRRSTSFAAQGQITQLEWEIDHWKTQRQYKQAQQAQRSVDSLKQLLEKERLKELDETHAQEQAANQTSFQESLLQLLQHWRQHIQLLQGRLHDAQEQLLSRQAEEAAALQAAQAAVPARPKFSPSLLNMRHIERTLALHKEFDKAHQVKQQADELELLELSQQDDELAAKVDSERTRLQAKHQREREAAAKKAGSVLQSARQRGEYEVEQLSRRFQAARLSLGRSQAAHRLALKQTLRGSLGLAKPSCLLGLPSFNTSLAATRDLVPTSPAHTGLFSIEEAGAAAHSRAHSPAAAARPVDHLPAAVRASAAVGAPGCSGAAHSTSSNGNKHDKAAGLDTRPYTRGKVPSRLGGEQPLHSTVGSNSNHALQLPAAAGASGIATGSHSAATCNCQKAAATDAAAGRGCGSTITAAHHASSSHYKSINTNGATYQTDKSSSNHSGDASPGNSSSAAIRVSTAAPRSRLPDLNHASCMSPGTSGASGNGDNDRGSSLQPDSPASAAALSDFASWGFAGSAPESPASSGFAGSVSGPPASSHLASQAGLRNVQLTATTMEQPQHLVQHSPASSTYSTAKANAENDMLQHGADAGQQPAQSHNEDQQQRTAAKCALDALLQAGKPHSSVTACVPHAESMECGDCGKQQQEIVAAAKVEHSDMDGFQHEATTAQSEGPRTHQDQQLLVAGDPAKPDVVASENLLGLESFKQAAVGEQAPLGRGTPADAQSGCDASCSQNSCAAAEEKEGEQAEAEGATKHRLMQEEDQQLSD